MRILHVIARLNVGGTARYVGRLAQDLPTHGVEVLVATGDVQGAEIEDPIADHINISRIPHLGRRIDLIADFKAWLELRKVLQNFRPDIIHTHTFKAGLIGRLLPTNARRVHTFHGHLLDDPEFAGWKQTILTQIERALARRTDAIITVGEKVAEDLLTKMVGGRSQYISIAPGIDALELPSRNDARKLLSITDETRPIVAWVARVTVVKAPHRVVELANKFPEARFLMAGGGDLLDEMRRSAPPNLTVLGWSDAAAIWAATDIALSTSDNEGMPVSLIEAQLAGVPVVATDVGGVSEVVMDEETGFVTETNTGAIAAGLARLLKDSNLRHVFGEAARERAAKLFTPEKMVTDHLNLYQRLLNRTESR